MNRKEETIRLKLLKSRSLLAEVEVKDESKRISIEDYNNEIEEALAQVRAGTYVTEEDFEKEMEGW